eukprot:2850798-Amphidinium_carterae.1
MSWPRCPSADESALFSQCVGSELYRCNVIACSDDCQHPCRHQTNIVLVFEVPTHHRQISQSSTLIGDIFNDTDNAAHDAWVFNLRGLRSAPYLNLWNHRKRTNPARATLRQTMFYTGFHGYFRLEWHSL